MLENSLDKTDDTNKENKVQNTKKSLELKVDEVKTPLAIADQTQIIAA